MKYFISLVVLFVSFVSFAGPEDHINNQSCYSLQKLHAPESIPQTVCVEEVSLDVATNSLTIYSYFQAPLYKSLKTTSVIRQTEDTYSFKAESLVYNVTGGGCEEAESVRLLFSGIADFNGYVDPTTLSVQVEHDYTVDSCHSRRQINTYNYLFTP